MADPHHKPEEKLLPHAAILAYLVPGLGHLYLGERKRAIFIFSGVMGLYLAGILIGGIDVIDRVEDMWWFVLQAGVGPIAWATDWLHQSLLKPPSGPDLTKSLGRVNEVGSLYTAMAGMLNAIALLDALWHPVKTRERRRADDELKKPL